MLLVRHEPKPPQLCQQSPNRVYRVGGSEMQCVIYKASASLWLSKYKVSLMPARLSRRARAGGLRPLLRADLEHTSHVETYTDMQFA